MIPYLTSPALSAIPYLEHGFFTRIGGESSGCFATLNTSLKKGENPDSVYENRHRICQVFNLPLDNLCTVSQEHTNTTHFVTKPFPRDAVPTGDALVTTTPNVLLGMKSADCVPILLADRTQPVVAAVHAGWRGAVGGVVENAVNCMKEKGARPENIVAALGPCIWQESFEVDQAFRDNLPGCERFFTPGKQPDHHLFDLPGYVTHRLNKTGITTVSPSPADTFADEERFFSFRRKTVTNADDFGNQMSVICIRH